ncbi:hypothetical protein [Oceanobacillus halotolerans]|uniref:hypothetical protein n=1 Tax=Oceanobacillus halotolerans TaxID=2663380 RepID=UPI0013DC1711|nr:hypothetical protein [Oceanobacillus halotolerans]
MERGWTNQATSYSVIRVLLFWCALLVVSSVYITTPLLSVFSDEFSSNVINGCMDF